MNKYSLTAPVLVLLLGAFGCANLVQSRPDLINRGLAAAGVDCTSLPMAQREQCARDDFTRIYPGWRADMNGDVIEDAFSAMGRIVAKENAGTITVAQGAHLWDAYYASLIQIADARLTHLQYRREQQAAGLADLGARLRMAGAQMQRFAAPPVQAPPLVLAKPPIQCRSVAFGNAVNTTCH